MAAIIKEVSVLETFEVRHPVLRAQKPLESCRFEGDDLETTKHFGLFSDGNLVGVVSVFENKSNKFSEKRQFQIRGMAVLPSEQGKGYGQKLLDFAEDFIKKEGGNLIWFNARSVAVRFYEKSGYAVKGNSFEIPGVGIHFVMYKKLILGS